MSLTPGTVLGPYRIEARIGAGGMGEVYQAHDTRLNRMIAIKVSREQFSDRFEREVRAVAALNHPNICTLHDVGPHYLVMELIDGATLAELMRDRPLPFDTALGIATQIADALDAAHAQGIVHRDLKPANVKIRPDGTVKVLDFGLAKRSEAHDSGGADPVNSPTLTLDAATRLGQVLGTARYMAPEQARGKPVDKRADIWAFGVVLYEMLVGQPPFAGETVSDQLAAVLTTAPDFERVPARARRLVQRCLEKDPRTRLHDIADARLWLEDIAADPAAVSTAAPAASRQRLLPWAMAGVALVVATLATIFWLRAPADAEDRSIAFTVAAPAGHRIAVGSRGAAVSPDGRALVFAAAPESGAAMLWLRSLDTLESRPLPGTEHGTSPFWSPDGEWIGFSAGGLVKKISLAGGAPVVLADVAPAAAAWGPDNTILIGMLGGSGGLRRISAFPGGRAESVTEIDTARTETGHHLPQLLPDGQRFLYFVSSGDPEVQGVYAGSVNRQQPAVRVLSTNRKALYAPPHGSGPGALVWVQAGSLVAQPFNASTLTLEGEPLTISDSVAVSQWNAASFWLSDTGVLAYMPGGVGNKARVFRRSRDGTRLDQIGHEEQIGSFFLSPDGTRLALDRMSEAGTYDIWIYEFRRQIMTRQTFDPRGDFLPQWSPDGDRIVFTSNRTGIAQLFVTATGGGAVEEVLTSGPNSRSLQWTRDGQYVLYANHDQRTQADLWALPLDGGRPPIPVVQTPFAEPNGQVSPDGKWLAYQSNESGRPEVYVQRFPPAGGKISVSSRGGTRPKWRGDGRELYFLSGDELMATPITITPDGIQPQAAVPLLSFTMPTQWDVTYPYEVTRDGQEFFVLEASAEQDVPLVVISGWQARLRH